MGAVQAGSDFVERLKYCRQLPSLPVVALRLVDLANNSSATLTRFAELISHDPALASKLLRVSNSSFYGRQQKVANLTQALHVLGLNATVTLSLSFSLRRTLAALRTNGFDIVDYWRKSLLTALACRTIAVELQEVEPENFFLAGLLQDIGVLVMHAELGEAYAVLASRSKTHADLMAREAAAFEFDHAQAGEWLLREWHLPDLFADSVRDSHAAGVTNRAEAADMDALPLCVAASTEIAQAWLDGATPEALEAAGEVVREWLAIDMVQYRRIITIMGQQMADLEGLFETDIADARLVQNAEDSAEELVVSRNMQDMESTSEAAARAEALKQRMATLEDQTRHDGMTGLFNREYLDRMLLEQFERANREHRPLSLAFVDVDQFKAINDSLGHGIGDLALVAAARRLSYHVRQVDMVFRYGGDEFIVLMPDAHQNDARALMEQVSANIRDTPVEVPGADDIQLTVTVGLATHQDGKHRFDSAKALISAADAALYAAKDAGRNRVFIHRHDSD